MWANVGGEIVDIVDFQCIFSINEIPRAIANIPVGREVRTLLPATSHLIATETQIMIPTNVYIQVGYGSGATNTILPVGTYLLFAGWVTGIGYRHSYDGLQMTLEITHWLSALSFASTMCQGSHPSNPSAFTFNQRLMMQQGAQAHIFPTTMGHVFFDGPKITNDLWGQSIKPWLEFLVGSRRLDQNTVGGNHNDSANSDAAAALNMFQGDMLPFDPSISNAGSIAQSIGNDIVYGTLQPNDVFGTMSALAQTNIWDKLIHGIAPNYRFAVIPFPHKALVVPFTAGLRNFWDPWGINYTFLARDLDTYNVNAMLQQPLRAFGFNVGHGGAHFDVQEPNDWDPGDMGGWYVARDDGLVVIRQAPRWLSEFAPPSAYSDLTVGVGGNVRGDGPNWPDEGVPPTAKSTKTLKAEQKTVLDRLAQASFVSEMLHHRSGRISGPLRFDVCPGSTVKIEGTAGAFLAGVDPHGEPRWATVSRVRYGISAQKPLAIVQYELSHIRTALENASDDTSVARHPLYDRIWVGDYMLQQA